MRRLVLALMLSALPGVAVGQQPLRPVAEQARSALRQGRLERLFQGAPRVQLRLPGVEPSAPVSAGQAAAALRDVFQGSETAEVTLEGFRQVGADQGYVELRRAFRVPGSPGRRTHQILLGYRLTGGRWVLVDLRVN
jgi:hypothetical protein